MRAREYIREPAASGSCHFTTTGAIGAMGGNPPAVRAKLRRLKQRGLTVEPDDGARPVLMSVVETIYRRFVSSSHGQDR
jgi:hypothetical protein